MSDELEMTNNPLFLRQLKLEEEMVSLGASRFRRQTQQETDKGRAGGTFSGMLLRKHMLDPLAEAIQAHINKALSGKSCRHSIAVTKMKDMDAHTLAYITLTVVLGTILKKELSFQSVAINVGRAVEDELRLREFQRVNKPFFRAVYENIKTRPNYHFKQRVMLGAMKQVAIPWDEWQASDKVHVGRALIELMIITTGLVKVVDVKNRRKQTIKKIEAEQKTLDWLRDCHMKCEFLFPDFLPMLVPPNPWRSLSEGGYYSDAIQNNFIKKLNPHYRERVAAHDLSTIFTAVNLIQDTPWRINTDVLEVVNYFWERGEAVAGLPPRDNIPLPPSPIPEDVDPKTLDEETRKIFLQWKREAKEVHDRNVPLVSKRLQTALSLEIANRFKNEVIYFPHNIDWRGRVYPIPNHLNPQRDDISRGLLKFAKGKRIQSSEALKWLAVHGANCFGNDKVSYEEREAFILENEFRVFACAQDPYACQWWQDADKPWQFLAFCFDWYYTKTNPNYESCISVQLDGSCNGLQHFSAMLRDEVGGRAVNLLPADKPQDIYQEVANKVVEKLELEKDKSLLAQEWLRIPGGIGRDLTKKPVMVLPYGGTKMGNRECVEQWLNEQIDKARLDESWFSASKFDATLYMSHIIWDSIGEVVVSAQQAMDWLKYVAGKITDLNQAIHWISPSGLPVYQAVMEQKPHRITTSLLGSTLKLSIRQNTDKFSKVAQKNGISPNFVHSLDAAMLHLYVIKLSEQGVDNFSLIHDSYGTLAEDTELSYRTLREVFVSMYQTNPLRDFLNQLETTYEGKVGFPSLPPEGTLVIERVKESAFFFS